MIGASIWACGDDDAAVVPGPADAGAGDAQASADAGSGPTSDAGVDAASADAAPDGPASSSLPECGAQRFVYLIANSGLLFWYGYLFPLPPMIDTFVPGYRYDDLSLVDFTIPALEHRLYLRKVGGRTLWQDTGTHPLPSVFVAGVNQTHTGSPVALGVDGKDVIANAVAAQKPLAAPIPALGFGTFPYTEVPDAGAPLTSTGVGTPTTDEVMATLRAKGITAEQEKELRPDPTVLAKWFDEGTVEAGQRTLAEELLITANAFRLGLVSTALIRHIGDDPHSAPNDATTTTRVNNLQRIVDSFYAELAKTNEPKCSHAGHVLSQSDNTVLVIAGDTMKNPYQTTDAIGDASPDNANVFYVRSNGYLTPGWFGRILPEKKYIFSPTTGAILPPPTTLADKTASDTAASLGVYYAITRGNVAATKQLKDTPFGGLVASP